MATLMRRSLTFFACSLALIAASMATTAVAQEREAQKASPPAARPAPPPRSQPSAPPRTAAPRETAPRGESGDRGRQRPVATPSGQTATTGERGRHRPGTQATGGQPTAAGRDRGDRPVIGVAAPRDPSRPNRSPRPGYYLPYPYGYGGFGLGYFFYDPYWWGYSSDGYGSPYGYGSAYGYGSPYGYGGYGSPSYQSGWGDGGVRLKVKPRDAQVFVDGYYAGIVDGFDGMFQRLTLGSGPHRIEVRADGYEPLAFEVRIYDDETVTYRGELRRLQP